jgi:uncharacterized protein (TIGR02453 family)
MIGRGGIMAKAAQDSGGFSGFPKETFAFLEGIAAHNDKAWFEAHRDLYEAGYVAPGRAFVEAIGSRLKKISPTVQYEAKANGSLGRINRDIRFSKDKRPYKDHLDIWFWHGDRKGWNCPGFWFRLTRKEVHIGVGMHQLEKNELESFRNSIVHPRSGKALLAAVAAVEKAGYEVDGKSRKIPPKGFATDADRADYLLYEGLHASTHLPAKAAQKPDFIDTCLRDYAALWPIGKWLLEEVAG